MPTQLRFPILIVFICFTPFLCNWFGGDDFLHLLWAGYPLDEIVARTFKGDFYQTQIDYHYRPIPNLLFALLTYQLSPLPLRVFILVIHIFNALLLISCIKRKNPLTPERIVFFLFIFHACTITNIYWLSALSDLLVTTCILLSYRFFLVRKLVLSTALFGCALLCKEIAFPYPLILSLLLIYNKELKRHRTYLGSLFCMAISVFLLRSLLLNNFLAGSQNEHYFAPGVRTVITTLRYLASVVLPLPIKFFFDYPLLLAIIPYSLYILYRLFKAFPRPLLTTTLLASVFVLTLLPVLNSFGSWYLYFPLAMLFLVLFSVIRDQPSWRFLIPFVLLSAAAHLCYGWFFMKTGEQAKAFVAKVSSLPERELHIPAIPQATYDTIPVFQSGLHLQKAVNLFHHQDKEFFLPAQVVFNGEAMALKPVRKNGNAIFRLQGRRNRFYLRLDTVDKKTITIESTSGKPTTVALPAENLTFIPWQD